MLIHETTVIVAVHKMLIAVLKCSTYQLLCNILPCCPLCPPCQCALPHVQGWTGGIIMFVLWISIITVKKFYICWPHSSVVVVLCVYVCVCVGVCVCMCMQITSGIPLSHLADMVSMQLVSVEWYGLCTVAKLKVYHSIMCAVYMDRSRPPSKKKILNASLISVGIAQN